MISYYFRKVICFFVGHQWSIVDYVLGMENGNVWNIKECSRCIKTEFD